MSLTTSLKAVGTCHHVVARIRLGITFPFPGRGTFEAIYNGASVNLTGNSGQSFQTKGEASQLPKPVVVFWLG